MFSSHVYAPVDKSFADNDENLYEIQRGQRAPSSMPILQTVTTNLLSCLELKY